MLSETNLWQHNRYLVNNEKNTRKHRQGQWSEHKNSLFRTNKQEKWEEKNFSSVPCTQNHIPVGSELLMQDQLLSL